VKLSDAIWGALLLALAGALLWHVQGFPAMPGQHVGPAALPSVLAVGFGVCGLLLLVRGLRARTAASLRWVEWPEWLRSRPRLLALAALVGVNVFYLAAVQPLGFVLVGVIYLFVLMTALRVPPGRALVLSVALTLLIHYGFYKLLKVPLPWGVLQPVAW
jgi:putative tricarboxylic transport membrane protein